MCLKSIGFPFTNAYKYLQPILNVLQPNKLKAVMQLCTVDYKQQIFF